MILIDITWLVSCAGYWNLKIDHRAKKIDLQGVTVQQLLME